MKKIKYILIFTLLLLATLVVTSCAKFNNEKPVTLITVTGAGNVSKIEILGGTLQMSAAVTPKDASDDSVTWIVIDGTGTATISPKGLLTALTNGTVTVHAISVSNKTVKGVKEVILTNQKEIDMNATLTNLTADGIQVMGFTPLHNDYIMVLSDGETHAPIIIATAFQSTAIVTIKVASNVNSEKITDRTATVSVTSADKKSTKVYTIVFESQIPAVNLRSADNFVILEKQVYQHQQLQT